MNNPTGKNNERKLLKRICRVIFKGQSMYWVYISNFVSEVGIERFTLPVTELPYPAITVCKKNGLYDPGEYLRAVFNQFQYAYSKDDEGSCNKTASLRSHYRNFVSTCDRKPRDDITAYVEKRWAEEPVSISSKSQNCG